MTKAVGFTFALMLVTAATVKMANARMLAGPELQAQTVGDITCSTDSGGTAVTATKGTHATMPGDFFPGTVIHCDVASPTSTAWWIPGLLQLTADPAPTPASATFVLGENGNNPSSTIYYNDVDGSQTVISFSLRQIAYGPLQNTQASQGGAERPIAHIPPLQGYTGQAGDDYWNSRANGGAGAPVNFSAQMGELVPGSNCFSHGAAQQPQIVGPDITTTAIVFLYDTKTPSVCLDTWRYYVSGGGMASSFAVSESAIFGAATTSEAAVGCMPGNGTSLTGGTPVRCIVVPPLNGTRLPWVVNGMDGDVTLVDPTFSLFGPSAQPSVMANWLDQLGVAHSKTFSYQFEVPPADVSCSYPDGALIPVNAGVTCRFESGPEATVVNWMAQGMALSSDSVSSQIGGNGSTTATFYPSFPNTGLLPPTWSATVSVIWRDLQNAIHQTQFHFTVRSPLWCGHSGENLSLGSRLRCLVSWSSGWSEPAWTGDNMQLDTASVGWDAAFLISSLFKSSVTASWTDSNGHQLQASESFNVLTPVLELRHVDESNGLYYPQAWDSLVAGSPTRVCLFASTGAPAASIVSLDKIKISTMAGSPDVQNLQLYAGTDGSTCFSWTSYSPGEQRVEVDLPNETPVTWDTNRDGNGQGQSPDDSRLIVGWNRLAGVSLSAAFVEGEDPPPTYSYTQGTPLTPAVLTLHVPPTPWGYPTIDFRVHFHGAHPMADGSTFTTIPFSTSLMGVTWSATSSNPCLSMRVLGRTGGVTRDEYGLDLLPFLEMCPPGTAVDVTINGNEGPIGSSAGNSVSAVVHVVFDTADSPRTYVVTDPGDDNHGSCGSQVCTLRDAIGAANAHPNDGAPDTIAFAAGIGTIATNGLPRITDAVILDGTTAFGPANSCESHNLAVSIRLASDSTYNGPGLILDGAGSVVRGLAIGGFGPIPANSVGNPAIVLNGNGGTVECNNLGTNADGTAADANGAGIIVNSANSTVRNNVLSGNVGWAGIILRGAGANGNIVEGNSIGTNAAGNVAFPNPFGIVVAGGQGNTVRNNLISGNIQAGIALDTTPQGVVPAGVASGNTITDNLIGMSFGAQSPLPNAVGIAVNNATNNQFTRNVIAYNTNNGAFVSLVNGQPLQGNVFSQNSIHDNGTQGLSVAGPQNPNVFYDHLPTEQGWETKLSAAVGGGFGAPPIAAGTVVRFEFFHSASCSAGLNTFGFGQGETFFAADIETVGASGAAVAHNVDISTVPSGHFITVTATVAGRSTSGFSRCISPGLRIDPAEQHVVSVSQSDQVMTISGWGFGPNTVAFMGNPAPKTFPTPLEVVSRTSTTSIQVKIPASRLATMGSFNLFVCNSTDVNNAPFALGCSPSSSVQVEPMLTGSTPQLLAGSPATMLTVTGTGFATPPGMEVWVAVNGAAGVPAPPSNVSATQFTIPIPSDWLATTGQLQIRVRVPGAQPTSNTITVLIINPAPHLTSLNPSSAVVGAGTLSVTLTGSGFRPESVVEGAPTGATWSFTDASHIALSLPTPTVGTLGLKVFTSGPGGGTSETIPLFVTQAAAPVSNVDVETVSNSQVTVSTGSPSTNAPSVQASTEAGSGTVAVAVYGSNPGGTPSFATGTAGGTNGTFVDVYVAPGSTFTSTTIQICDPNGGDVLYWYNSTSQAWVQVSATIVSGPTPPPTCFSLNVTDGSVPSLTDLQGAIFGVGRNRPPTAGVISGPSVPIALGGSASVSLPFTDSDSADIHTVSWNWGDGSSSAGTVTESGGAGTASGTHQYSAAGIYAVTAMVSDNHGQTGSASYQFVVVFDPSSAGHGSGWFTSPSGTSTAKPNATGKAEFGFELKYKKGSTTPTGDFEFHFDAAGIEFHELSIDWLVVSDPSIVFRGTGKLGNSTGYSFQVWATTGGKGVGTVRVRIWKTSDGTVIYESEPAAPPSPTIKIGGGKIAIKD